MTCSCLISLRHASRVFRLVAVVVQGMRFVVRQNVNFTNYYAPGLAAAYSATVVGNAACAIPPGN